MKSRKDLIAWAGTKSMEDLIALLKLAPSTQDLTEAEIGDWVDRNIEFSADGKSFRRRSGDVDARA